MRKTAMAREQAISKLKKPEAELFPGGGRCTAPETPEQSPVA